MLEHVVPAVVVRGALVLAVGLSGCAPVAARAGAEVPRPSATRSIRLSRDYSLAAMTLVVELRERGAEDVRGRAWMASGNANRRTLQQQYGCEVQPGAREIADLPWSCEVPFARGAPNWAALLARLDALGIMAPPRDPPSSASDQLLCADGAPWTVTVRLSGRDSVLVEERESCLPRSPQRIGFEAGIDSVLREVEKAARIR